MIYELQKESVSMKTAGIIAEFNPFHNGHKYLIGEIKYSYADAVIAVMSGSFVQRGDIAVTDKWTRAAIAVKYGADLVLELPAVYSMNTAQKFAFGAVSILNASGAADMIAFGSESGDTRSLAEAARVIAEEPPEVSEKIKEYSSAGITYPAARKRAFEDICGVYIPDSPNDILAVEYLRAVYETGSALGAQAVPRLGAGHDSEAISGGIASASEIRRRLYGGIGAEGLVPDPNFDIYDPSRLDAAVIGKIRTGTAEHISGINDVCEGLENKFIKAARECSTVGELCMAVKSKRYTLSRIRRIAWSVLLDLTGDLCSEPPGYIRVLAMNRTGREILRKMKKTASVPVVIKAADYAGAGTDRIFAANSRAEDWFALCAPRPELRRGGRDMTMSPVIIDE